CSVEAGTELGDQLLAQLQIVVDLAVEHQGVPRRGPFRSPLQRLPGVAQVDDRQAVEAQGQVVVVPGCPRIRAAMALAAQRRLDRRCDLGGGAITGQKSEQTTHRRYPPSMSCGDSGSGDD